jgi:hypothetical protein
LILDEEAIYDPAGLNDRILLGLNEKPYLRQALGRQL